MRWVLPYTKEERCACTKVVLGGVNIVAPQRAKTEIFYFDDPLPYVYSPDVESLHDLFQCHDVIGKLASYSCEFIL